MLRLAPLVGAIAAGFFYRWLADEGFGFAAIASRQSAKSEA